MDILDEISQLFIWLTRVGVIFRVAFCFFKKIGNDEEAAVYNKRMKNAITFYILAESIFQIKDIAMYYFGG
ncbi:mercury transporter [Alkaliphilus sp. MSJ-5]|uniref:Mercury transporter n=1 Tax=Alkaliphilus flagellatus TaxID=2841507 RepID=A0ABS6G655_9FIRM|nr:mercury transporter [Alkaliphilus flagellatus]MBU5676905.1 mercury transporter [Alkaliphilus flagellatus]